MAAREALQLALRLALPATVDMLHRRRASDIPDGYIDRYVALHWLEWHGGGLKVTTTGENICRQVMLGLGVEPAGPLSSGEQAELRRQGAKAAARGESSAVNPLDQQQNSPDRTGESQSLWSARSDAWQAGHAFERSKSDDADQR